MQKPKLALIVAMSENRVIGRDNALPWHLKSDLKLFKAATQFKPIIMGSNTWDSLPRKPLPGRLNLVCSRDLKFEAEGGIVCNSLFEALDIAREHAADDGADEVVVIGGANIYEQTLPKADRLYVTEVHTTLDGDARFPEIDPAQWVEVKSEFCPKAEGDDYDFTVKVYERKRI
ncbi:dihydrofolate reductase [Asticcacaulis excentricus]|uniref:Dihydrofolate reductase n=1 Tax=Asticcacaulis excentricus (strain ATCC 15261 / DSM 4724 / KCTC 12464 / NCIMB 9791 / VKM B-1370 / CB 48) TaxID=573065 RepID=E8RRF4_ASTEC|nr:dihydrofolate reductase [Asticcacaulis excentricus]ADU13399.1 Dihydrofolate reductase [Asticcacaulis excentricus CB 48]